MCHENKGNGWYPLLHKSDFKKPEPVDWKRLFWRYNDRRDAKRYWKAFKAHLPHNSLMRTA